MRVLLSAREAGGVPDPEGGTEELLDPGVERPQHAVELVLGDGGVGQLADEEDRVLLADRERGAVQLEVAAQEVLVELLVVLLGRGHHVRLVVQRALAQGEPDRERVLLLTLHAHVPTALIAVAAIDGGDRRVLEALTFGPRVDALLERVEGRVVEGVSHSRRARAGSGRSTAAAAVPRSSTT